MKALLSKIGRVFNQLKGLFPSALPQGMSEFEAWSKSITETYALPTQDETSIRHTLATMIINLGPTVSRKPKYYFVVALRASAAKQIAGAIFYEIQMAKRKAQEAEMAKAVAKSPEATVKNGLLPSGQA